MAHSYHHAISSSKRYGGTPDDFIAVHSWFDATKSAYADQRHRAVLHNAYGIFLAEETFGLREEVRLLRAALDRLPRWVQRLLGMYVPSTTPTTITISTGKRVPIRFIAEQHVIEDCGFIPTLEQYLGEIPRKPWMYRGAQKLHHLSDPTPSHVENATQAVPAV